MPSFSRRALPFLAILLAGCTAAPQAGYGPRAFVLDAAQAGGSLRVRLHVPALAPAAGKRGLLATIADVDRLVITVAAADGPRSATIQRADLVAGTATTTFADLPAGPVEVTILAYDAGGQVIGRDVRTAAITAAGAAQVAAVLQLKPSAPTARTLDRTPLNGPGAPTTGGLAAQVTIVDGLPATLLTYHGAYRPPVVDKFGRFAEIDADADGAVWTTWDVEDVAEAESLWTIARIKTDGTVQPFANRVRDYHWRFKRAVGGDQMVGATDEHGNMELTAFRSDGAIAARSFHDDWAGDHAFDFSPSASGVCFFTDGRLSYRGLFGLVPGGEPAALTPVDFPRYPLRFMADRRGGMAYLEGIEDDQGFTAEIFVVRCRADGSEIFRQRIYAGDNIYPFFFYEQNYGMNLVVDAADTIWATLPEDGRIIRFDAAGTRLPDVGVGFRTDRLYADPLGRIWNLALVNGGVITRFGADARPAAHYAFGEDLMGYTMAVTADDHVWVGDGDSILHFEVP